MLNISQTLLNALLSGYLVATYLPIVHALDAKLYLAKAQNFGLSPRASDGCADSSFTQCLGHNFPANFCCPSSTSCLPINGAKTIICCPVGQTCQFIQPITCNIQQQNATAHPENYIKSTDLTSTLKKCGTDCCPDGYSCQNNICLMDNGSSPVSSGSPTSTASPTASNGVPNIGGASNANCNASNSSSLLGEDRNCPSFPGRAVVAGFFPGAIAGALATAIVFFLLAKRQQQKELAQNGEDRKTISKVSPPMYEQRETYRTDFLRRASRAPGVSRARSLFTRSPVIGTPKSSTSHSSRRQFADEERHTPTIRRLSSTESIDVVLSPPPPLRVNGGLRPPTQMTSHTTFTEMMTQARYNRGTMQHRPPISDTHGDTYSVGGRI
ncbi:hypothetical protein L228DRAFT_281845 [Xylona heveae TC161]|uniref:Mid2 domain-containing protein n=1 Tax=Xylona heveae (strain CBS 132557 / TC161) TaxID=1328760 RepID=A0A165IF18_XYLHT|nr:hypothetical protein L228DRAFT_281845 [Xylona heveae TC161]KZF24804.1 hypothetical protein L228DRAFT_281845 [Xylona heveae TC161]